MAYRQCVITGIYVSAILVACEGDLSHEQEKVMFEELLLFCFFRFAIKKAKTVSEQIHISDNNDDTFYDILKSLLSEMRKAKKKN